MPKTLYDIIVDSIDGAELVDVGSMLTNLRLTKSDAEIVCIPRAIGIADEAFTAMLDAAKPGVTELELAGITTGTAMTLGRNMYRSVWYRQVAA